MNHTASGLPRSDRVQARNMAYHMHAKLGLRTQWEWLAYHMHAKSDFCVPIARISNVLSRVICTQTEESGLRKSFVRSHCKRQTGDKLYF